MEPTAKKLNVLLIEDSESDVFLTVKHLKQHFAEVNYLTVYTLDAISEALESDWDVIISDFSLPGFDGMTALRLVRETRSKIPFILLSGQVTEDVASLMMRLGANDYVFKNNLSRLAPAVLREIKYTHVSDETKTVDAPEKQKRSTANKLLPPIAVESNITVSELQKSVINMLLVTEYIRKRQAEVLEKQNLTVTRLNILRILKRAFPQSITIRGIQKEMIYKTVDLSRTLDKMNKEGLINASYSTTKKTSKEVAITAKGIETLNDADKYSDEMFLPESFLSEENAQQINEALQSTLNAIK